MSRPWLPNDDDQLLLEQMATPEIAWTAVTLAYETDLSYETIRNRLKFLARHDYIQRPEHTPEGISGEGVWVISDLGKRYLSGEATIEELREHTRTDDDTG